MSPDSPIMSAPISRALVRILSQETMTPMSVTSKPLHESTTPTMFLPMSCTSPFTVAMRNFPADDDSTSASGLAKALAAFSTSMNGSSQATDFFITRADFTTCGRNILPAPKRSPTTPMPSIKGPSITFKGTPYLSRAASVSSSMKRSMPLSNAYSRRFSTGSLRHERSSSIFLPVTFLKDSAKSNKRSVASGRRLRITSSTFSNNSVGI